ncbi:hypothetical protein AVEN_238289-1 [Araneus ventricosus]|uniref:Mos1 transposase HTH domain-containing protein n=1 Tax=Araneus ventricosus TaxID=182803 RepID=A0A4Y2TPT4_ARAVE|nr:hypothetical protein AVEN_6165-1 [Araneus ventricosus]GBO01418.1 hypothetical protein AVEN_238289-1 [Araneus ventricosus]
MLDSSRSARRAVIQFLRAEWEHASQIYPRMKEVYGEKCLARCTIFRWCQRYEAGRVNIKDLPRPGQAHIVSNSATISAVDELIRQNRRITTHEIAVEQSITKGTVHHIITKSLVRQSWCTVGAQASVREPSSFYIEAILSLIMSIIYCYTIRILLLKFL